MTEGNKSTGAFGAFSHVRRIVFTSWAHTT